MRKSSQSSYTARLMITPNCHIEELYEPVGRSVTARLLSGTGVYVPFVHGKFLFLTRDFWHTNLSVWTI